MLIESGVGLIDVLELQMLGGMEGIVASRKTVRGMMDHGRRVESSVRSECHSSILRIRNGRASRLTRIDRGQARTDRAIVLSSHSKLTDRTRQASDSKAIVIGNWYDMMF
jgi:hypothetical protein